MYTFVAYLRASFKILLFILATLIIVLSALAMRILEFPHRVVFKHYVLWRKITTLICNVKLECAGSIPTTPGILMANHRSYFDVALVHSKNPCVYVAKSVVRKWPLFGFGGDAMRTIWVDRNSKTSRQKTREEMKKRLQDNLSVILFPEGTTTTGPEILPYKPGMFYTVASGNFPVYCVAIEYKDQDVAWVDKDLFIPHLFNLFQKKEIGVKMAISGPYSSNNAEELKEKIETLTQNQVMAFRAEWDA